MNFINQNPTQVEEHHLKDAAEDLGCEVAAIKAVVEIEAHGEGYFSDGHPKMLFESRLFNNFTGGRFINHPLAEKFHLATWNWRRNYFGGVKEYERLGAAIQLDEVCALRAASWGMFQILGDNEDLCGYRQGDVKLYVEDVVQGGEPKHLQDFVTFIQLSNLAQSLRDHEWNKFARRFNGPGYRKNNYARKMQSSYIHFSSGQPLAIVGRGIKKVEDLQAALIANGEHILVDGIIGPMTIQAVKDFQLKHGLVVDGIAGPMTWAELEKDSKNG